MKLVGFLNSGVNKASKFLKRAQVLKNLELSPVFIVLSSQQTDGQAERKRQVDFHGLHVDTEDLLVRPAQG